MSSEYKLIKGAKVVNQGIISSSDVLIKGEIIHKISSEIILRDNFDAGGGARIHQRLDEREDDGEKHRCVDDKDGAVSLGVVCLIDGDK